MNFVFAAYLVVLIGIGFYAWSLNSRFAQVKRDMSASGIPPESVDRDQ